jgi:hypothetical protein
MAKVSVEAHLGSGFSDEPEGLFVEQPVGWVRPIRARSVFSR